MKGEDGRQVQDAVCHLCGKSSKCRKLKYTPAGKRKALNVYMCYTCVKPLPIEQKIGGENKMNIDKLLKQVIEGQERIISLLKKQGSKVEATNDLAKIKPPKHKDKKTGTIKIKNGELLAKCLEILSKPSKVSEIADKLEIDPNTVRALITRGRAKGIKIENVAPSTFQVADKVKAKKAKK